MLLDIFNSMAINPFYLEPRCCGPGRESVTVLIVSSYSKFGGSATHPIIRIINNGRRKFLVTIGITLSCFHYKPFTFKDL